MRIFLSLLIAIAAPGAAFAQSCTAYGAATICDNGLSGTRYGPEPARSNRFGNSTGLDGGSNQLGGMTIYNDGTTANHYGNTIIFNDGRVCHRYGNSLSCY
jgi:hypothetical protein